MSTQRFVLLLLALTCVSDVSRGEDLCRSVIASLPAYASQETALSTRARFELRECNPAGLLEIALFEPERRMPSVVRRIPDTVRSTYHIFNVLVVQTIGGSSSTVYIFQFERGRALPPRAIPTKGGFRVFPDDSGSIIIEIPPEKPAMPPQRLQFTPEVVLHQ